MSTRTGVLSPRVDHRHQQSQLRLLRRLLSPIAGRHQKPTHLGDRVPAQSEHSRRVPPTVPLQAVHTGEPPPIYLHLEHPRPPSPNPEEHSPFEWPIFTPPREGRRIVSEKY